MVRPVSRGASHAVPPGPETYVVEGGDSFDSIAQKKDMRTVALENANPGLDPRKLRAGMHIVIPHERPQLHDSHHLSHQANHAFARADLKPAIAAAAQHYHVPPEAVAGILMQESTSDGKLVNYLFHKDGTGTGLCGLDPSGELDQFRRWSHFNPVDRKGHRRAIPPLLQIEYLAMRLSEKCKKNGGDIWQAVATWHSWEAKEGAKYVSDVRARLATLKAQ